MNYLPFLFVLTESLSAIFYRRLYYCLNTLLNIADPQQRQKHKVHVVVVDRLAIFFISYVGIHILFLIYCGILLMKPAWEPGCMLLLLSAIESYAVKSRIPGSTVVDEDGFVYPTFAFKLFISSLTIFVLLRLVKI